MFRAFPKRDGPRILLLESVDYEQVNTTEWLKKNDSLQWAGVVNFHCMRMSLVMSM